MNWFAGCALTGRSCRQRFGSYVERGGLDKYALTTCQHCIWRVVSWRQDQSVPDMFTLPAEAAQISKATASPIRGFPVVPSHVVPRQLLIRTTARFDRSPMMSSDPGHSLTVLTAALISARFVRSGPQPATVMMRLSSMPSAQRPIASQPRRRKTGLPDGVRVRAMVSLSEGEMQVLQGFLPGPVPGIRCSTPKGTSRSQRGTDAGDRRKTPPHRRSGRQVRQNGSPPSHSP